MGLSLTPKEYTDISHLARTRKKIVESREPPFSHILVTKGRCPFLTGEKLCSIYEKRPAVCVCFPLTFTYTPEGEMFVNFIRCEGEGIEDGDIVDETFVHNTIQEVESRNPTYFDELRQQRTFTHQRLTPFYTLDELTDFDTKQLFKEQLAKMLLANILDGHNFRAACHAFFTVVKNTIESTLRAIRHYSKNKVILILTEDVHRLLKAMEDRAPTEYQKLQAKYIEMIEEKERWALENDTCEILWEGSVRRLRLDEPIQVTDIVSANKSYVKASTIFLRKKFTAEALRVVTEHLAEILVRIDLGGFPMDAPFLTMLDTLVEYVNNLETQCNIHAGEGQEVGVEAAERAVQDLDTSFVLGNLYARTTGIIGMFDKH